jgi:hypothetical protein
VWDAKAEPKIVELFETIWGTDKLTVSFGGSNAASASPVSQFDLEQPSDARRCRWRKLGRSVTG